MAPVGRAWGDRRAGRLGAAVIRGVEITKDVASLPAPIAQDKAAAVNDAPPRRRRKKAGLIEIELAGGRRVRVDRDVDAAALERVLDVLSRR